VQKAAGRIPVIAGTGANSTSEAIHLTKLADEVKADACLLVVPYYNKPTQEGLYLHYKAIADAVAIPQILYNVPGRTVLSMHNETVERLAGIENIIGIKDATGDLESGKDLINRVADKMTVVSGDDGSALDLIKLGAKGNISVTANVLPQLMSQLCEGAVAGDESADQINVKLAKLNELLFCESNPIPVKWVLNQMGLIGSGIRLPLTELSSASQPALLSALKELDIALV